MWVCLFVFVFYEKMGIWEFLLQNGKKNLIKKKEGTNQEKKNQKLICERRVVVYFPKS